VKLNFTLAKKIQRCQKNLFCETPWQFFPVLFSCARSMKQPNPFSLAALLFLTFTLVCFAQQEPPWEIHSQNPNGEVNADLNGEIATFRNGVVLSNRSVGLTADTAIANQVTGEVQAEGTVTILGKSHIWRGTNIIYNFKTSEMRAGSFRTGQAPFYISGEKLSGSESNKIYSATNALITTDNYAEPSYKMRARSIVMVPGQYFEAHDATLFLGEVPVFYYPLLRRSLVRHPNNFEFTPGYRSTFGPYLLGSYNWFWNEKLDGALHVDWRQKRGVGGGPDLNYHLGNIGDGSFKYYFAHDEEPNADTLPGQTLPEERQRISFTHQATIASNLTAKIVARYQTDPQVVRDFFEGEYRKNVQPSSFAEVNQLWQNWSLDVIAQPRLVTFFETVERLPEIKLSGFRQQVGATPVFYESESSLDYLERRFAGGEFADFGNANSVQTNLPQQNFSATRADTFQQFILPETFFGWLNVTPRVGGRVTYYSEVDGDFGTVTNFVPNPNGFSSGPFVSQRTTNEQVRGVFNTGVEFSAKASRVWNGAENKFWDVHELRHILEPSINYVYVPSPTRRPSELPQFDYEVPSLRLLPIDFPEYNALDSIDSQNILRLTLLNKLQTKRADGVENLVNWAVYTDWRLNRRFDPITQKNQTTFSDLFSDLDLRPRHWLTINSQTRYDLANTRWREIYESLVVQPNNTWSASLSYRYLRNNDPEFVTVLDPNPRGNKTLMSSIYCRMNENWAARISHRLEARDGTMEEQYDTIYRDLRSWTGALTLRLRDNRGIRPNDYTIAVTFSLKAFPRFGLGSDSDLPSLLLGS